MISFLLSAAGLLNLLFYVFAIGFVISQIEGIVGDKPGIQTLHGFFVM